MISSILIFLEVLLLPTLYSVLCFNYLSFQSSLFMFLLFYPHLNVTDCVLFGSVLIWSELIFSSSLSSEFWLLSEPMLLFTLEYHVVSSTQQCLCPHSNWWIHSPGANTCPGPGPGPGLTSWTVSPCCPPLPGPAGRPLRAPLPPCRDAASGPGRCPAECRLSRCHAPQSASCSAFSSLETTDNRTLTGGRAAEGRAVTAGLSAGRRPLAGRAVERWEPVRTELSPRCASSSLPALRSAESRWSAPSRRSQSQRRNTNMWSHRDASTAPWERRRNDNQNKTGLGKPEKIK